MKKIHMIGNTHFDPVWLWEWDEALSSILSTLRSAVKRMEEYPDFTYSFSAPAVLEWVERTDPDLFLKIKKYVSEGRWELCEGWWLQADCNAASGESYVRQGLYAQRYYLEKFNMTSQTVFNIDSFGHPVSLVQILNGCGIKNYVFWRPNQKQYLLKTPLFNWCSENGALRAYRIGGAGGDIFKADIEKDTLDPLINNAGALAHDTMAVYGVTDHGGAPTVAMIDAIHKKQKDFDIVFSRVDSFFDAADMHSLPNVYEEIQVHFLGPYSNFTEIKKNNRRAEYALTNAEKVSVIANKLVSLPYDKKTLYNCWRDVMFGQFHDILGGCSIESAYADARDLHGRAIRSAREITHFSLQSITNKIKMLGKNPDDAWNIVLWNLNGFDVDTYVEAEVQWAWEFDWYKGGIVLVDDNGCEYETQIISERSVIPGFRSRFVFKAELPALGYKTFAVKQCEAMGDTSVITQSPDLKTLLRPYAVFDDCDTWGFNKTVYENNKQYLDLKECKLIEDGVIRKSYRLTWEFKNSTVTQVFHLYTDRVECRYRVLWNEQRFALKFEFKNKNDGSVLASAPYGRVVRTPDVYEKPMGEWLKLGDTAVVSDSIFAYSFDGACVGLTVLRNCIFGDLRTEPLDSSKDYSFMGQGVSEGKIMLVKTDNPDKAGAVLNNPPVVVVEANHDGTLPPCDRFLSVNGECVVTALKMEEDGENYIARLYNPSSETVADLTLFDTSAVCTLKSGEVATLAFDKTGAKKTNMLEK